MNKIELKNTIEKYHTETNDNVYGVGYGYKEKNGLFTDEKVLKFFVLKKKSLSELHPNEILPTQITIDGEIIGTDVVQGFDQLVQSCGDDSVFYSWGSPDHYGPPPSNREKIRPLKGGLSICNYTITPGGPGKYYSAGTMGFIGIDNDTGSLVGVTNNHVIIDDAFICSERNKNGLITNVMNHDVVQPGSLEYVSQYPLPGEYNPIGKVKRYYPLTTNGRNEIDVAIFTLDPADIDITSCQQEGINGWTTFLDFATTQEIDDLFSGQITSNLYSSGRTTGAKGEGQTKLLLSTVDYSFSGIVYEKQGIPTPVSYNNTFKFIARNNSLPPGENCYYPIAAGDSGSAVTADFNGVRKIIGLVFAGTSDYDGGPTKEAIACRIDRIAELMNISPLLNLGYNVSDPSMTEQYTVNGLDNRPYVEVDGKKYWQVGLRSV